MAPRATYRLQLQPGFGFDEAAAVVPYLARLGVSHVYLSPILQAAPGSTHGYDVVDHDRLSDELGGASGFEHLSRAAAAHDLSLVVDIVPNHMALAGAVNRWWWDVLEDGQASPYARAFDIDWDPGPLEREPSVLVPILADHYGRVLEAGGIRVAREGGRFLVRGEGFELPLHPRSVAPIVRRAAERLGGGPLADAAAELAALDRIDDAAARREARERAWQQIRAATAADPTVGEALDQELASLNGDVDALDALLDQQAYRLAHWRAAAEELDYRRFFDITTLAGLRVEDPVVFAGVHRVVLDLVRAGDVAGLRIDHVDGLRDPAAYLRALRAEAPDAWIVVEKILAADELLPEGWPVEGTTGYELADRVGDLFVDPEGFATLVEHHQRWTASPPFADVCAEARLEVMRTVMSAEVERVAAQLAAVCSRFRRHRDHTPRALRTVVEEVAAAMDVYRTYAAPGSPTSAADRARVGAAVARAAAARPDLDRELLSFLERMLVLDEPGDDVAELALRFQQLTAPVTAKGVEDTALYRWVPLVSRNDVGTDPARSGRGVEPFHAHCEVVAERWPDTMLNLSTHDSKRSGDVRARTSCLSEVAEPWCAAVDRWRDANAARRDGWDDPTMELLLYETLVGAWPIEADRVHRAMEKAVREAKVHTSWRDPDEGYEAGMHAFASDVLADPAFVGELEDFLEEHDLVRRGALNSLAQVAIELTAPGVPDIYQGDELWRHLLVDPDNRRAVDFDRRAALLDEVDGGMTAEEAMARLDEGLPKLWLIHRVLRHRRAGPGRYRGAPYTPLLATGPEAERVVAFARNGLVTIVPRLGGGLAHGWSATKLELPPGRWTSVLVDEPPWEGVVLVEELLAPFPVAVLERIDG